ncbi:MAG: hypothetical protein KC944_07580 [Candidatus Omnitrophica bacterium]|nr:hypothetical protein [Candidatus Omnitrophota bacterium]
MSEPKQVLEEMQSRLAHLQDIHNSQVAHNEKIAGLQMELLERPDQELDKGLGTALSNASKNAEIIGDLAHDYEIRINKFKSENDLV